MALQPLACDTMKGGEALRLPAGYHEKGMTNTRVGVLLAQIHDFRSRERKSSQFPGPC